jgi:hypothetical protein
MIVSSKIPTKLFPDLYPEIFKTFLGLPVGSLFMILLNKSPGSPKSFQEAPRKLQKESRQNPGNNFGGM